MEIGNSSPQFRLNYAAIALLLLLPVLSGCRTNFLNENDKLRRENMGLKDKVQELNRSLALKDDQVKLLEAHNTPEVLKNVKGVEVPRIVAIDFDHFSGLLDPKLGEKSPTLRLYLKVLDQEGRFIPVAGRAQVQVVWLQPTKPPTVLAQMTFEPKAFDDSYRSGFTGTHYTLDIPLAGPLPVGVDSLTAKLVFLDAATNATITKEGAFQVKAPETQPTGK